MSNGNGTKVATGVVQWLAIIGALNWGLVGFFNWDLVRALLGNDAGTSASAASRAIYALVGLSGVGLAVLSPARRNARASSLARADART